MRTKQIPAIVLPSMFFAAIFACGSRTGLLLSDTPLAEDSGPRRDGSDARADVNRDVQCRRSAAYRRETARCTQAATARML
jgi:hypothetical protein